MLIGRNRHHLRLNSLADVDAVKTSHKMVIASAKALAYSLVTLVLTAAAAAAAADLEF